MAFTLVQAGQNLYPVNTDGAIGPALTMPTGIALITSDPTLLLPSGQAIPGASRVPRFARFKRFIVLVNTPTRPVSIDTAGVVRPLTPNAPPTSVTLTSTGSGGLTGNYLSLVTYVIKDPVGNDISESDYSSLMGTPTVPAAQQLTANWTTSVEPAVNASRLYRTTANGSVYFPWIDTPGRTTATVTSNASDAQIQLIARPARGAAPDLTLIAEWAGRLWGVDRFDVDNLRYTEAGTMFAWSGLNTLPIPHLGEDRYGLTALAPRQNVLGVGRRNNIMSVAGATTADFRPIAVSENLGFLSQESVVTYRDAVFFLWEDGVYRWDDAGITCLSDAGNVRSWFTSTSYFNRSMFASAFSVLDPIAQTYRLFLCSPGATQTDRWVELNLRTGKWYGPHRTDAFSPTCALAVRGNKDMPLPMVGSLDGFLSQDVAVRSDWRLTPIAEDVVMTAHVCGDPDSEKYFGELSVFTEVEPRGTLRIDTIVGNLEDTTGLALTHTLTQSRERLDRLGEGKYATLRFRNAEVGQDCVIHGYTIPYHVTGRR